MTASDEQTRSERFREPISESATERLSVYLRCLGVLEAAGVETISSKGLADRFGLNSAQIRKDLANFGELGIRGVGYNVRRLRAHLQSTLGLDSRRAIVIAGAGNLGLALADYEGFNSDGFQIVCLLDSDPDKARRRSRSGIPVRPVSELQSIVRESGAEIGILAVPAEAVQEICDAMAEAGIRAILNFAPVRPQAPQGVKVKSVDLRINLETLSFFLVHADLGID